MSGTCNIEIVNMASDSGCRLATKAITMWLVFTNSFTLVSGGRYGNPAEIAKYAVPFTISVIILIGMLGLLCYFKRHDIKERCSCLTGARRDMDAPQHRQSNPNKNCQVTIPTVVGCTASKCYHTEQTKKALPPDRADFWNAEKGERTHSSCPGCGSPYSKDQGQVKDNRSDKNSSKAATKGFARFFKSKKNPKGVSSTDNGDKFPEGKELTCENCFQMKFLRKALKDQDITNVGLTLETSDACHI